MQFVRALCVRGGGGLGGVLDVGPELVSTLN